MTLVHWSAFDDSKWACGGKWPEPLSRRPLIYGPHYPRCSPDPKQTTCPACQAYSAWNHASVSAPESEARGPKPEAAESARLP